MSSWVLLLLFGIGLYSHCYPSENYDRCSFYDFCKVLFYDDSVSLDGIDVD